MRRLLHRHLFFSLLAFLLLSSGRVWAAPCPNTVQIVGRTVLCEGEETILRAPDGFTYLWYKDGVQTGVTSRELQVTETGRYRVEVSGSTCDSNTSSEIPITVNSRPAPPNFTVTPSTAACAGTALAFSVNNADDALFIYSWDFGDGNTARGSNVTYAYDLRGTGVETFDVTVFATSRETSCESEPVVREVQVRPLPEISFTEENDFQACLEEDVEDEDISVTAVITNTTAEPFLSDIRSYFVDWGDGNGEVQYQASAFPISNPNPYTEVGDFEIVIRAVSGNGCEELFTQNYSVSREPTAGFQFERKREDESQQPPCVPIIVTIEDTAKGGGLTYEWKITPDQGYELVSGTLTDQNPVFKFTVSGVYTIEQIVANACKVDGDTASQSIVVGWPQVQPPQGGVFCGSQRLDLSGFSLSGGGIPGGGGGIGIDKNFGENITVTVGITGPQGATTRTFNSDNFTYGYDFDRPGTYNITVEAVNECGSSNSIFQGQPQPPIQVIILQQPGQPTIQNPGIICEGDFVELTPTAPGPNYAWFDSDDPSATPIFIGQTFTTPPLPAGNNDFFVAARDSAQGVVCIGPKKRVTVTANPRIANNLIEGDETRSVCRGGVVAQLTGTRPSGGDETTPYAYTWLISTTAPNRGYTAAPGVNNNQNYTPTQPINATTWFRRVVRSANCSPDSSNVVEVIAVEPVPLSANTISPTLQEICTGDEPAQLIGSQPSSGAGGPYTYRWELSTTGPDAGFVAAPAPNSGENYSPSGLSGDTWFRRIVISGNCESPSEAVRIRVFPALANNTVTPAQQNVCTGTAPAPLTGSAPSGGSGNYTYEWQVSTTGASGNFTAATGTNNQQSYTPGSITQTTWYQRVVRSGQCTPSISEAVVINVRPSITGNSISAPQEVCSGVVPAALTGSTPSGGSGNITYRWESSISGPTAGFNPAPGNNTGASYTPPALTRDTWFRRVALSEGCDNASEAIKITVLPLPTAPVLTVREARACPGGPATLTVSNAGGNTIEWYDAPTGGTPLFVGTTFVTPDLDRNTTFYVQAVNNSQCISATRTAAPVIIVAPQADAGPDVTIMQGQTTELRASGGVIYQWEPAAGLSSTNVSNPVASPDVTTTYTVTITTEEGCTAADEVTVTVIPAITAPNAFSPNGDRVNDVWEIENIQNYPDARIEIFNRWGNQIFSSTGYATPWDGTYNGESLPVATYYYIIYLNSSEKPISGHVTIIR